MTSVVRMGRQMPSVATDLITLCDAVALSHGGALRWPLGSPAVSEAWIHRGTLVAVGRVGSQWRNRRSEPLLKGTYVRGKQFFKIGGFIGTLTAGAALVATATAGTGAYFTDSHPGTITAQAGHLRLINVSSTAFDFRDIMPGEDKTLPVDYQVDVSSGKVDIWLTFDTSTAAYARFTGAKGQNGWADGGLGRFGHFKVTASGATLFNSYNLQNAPDGTSGCVDSLGHGGSAPAQSHDDTSMGYCGVPKQILVASGLSNNEARQFQLTFGLTGRQVQQNQLDIDHLPFQLVATQAGHAPDAANF